MTTNLIVPVAEIDDVLKNEKIETLTAENGQSYELDIKEDVSQELIIRKYIKPKTEENQSRIEIFNIDRKIDHPKFFLDMNVEVINDLLQDTFNCKEHLEENKYDAGSNITYARENIITGGYEVELTESPIFSLLDIPSGVTIKGDGDYERIQKINEIYLNNIHDKSHIKIDNITQSINSSMQKEEECQTLILSKNTVKLQVKHFNIIDTYNEIDTEQNVSLNQQVKKSTECSKYVPVQKCLKLFKDTEAYFNMTMIMGRILAQNTLNAVSTKQIGLNDIIDHTKKPLSENEFLLTYYFTLENKTKNCLVKCMHWHETETHLVAVAYSKFVFYDYEDKPTAVAIWSLKNPHTPERLFEFNESVIACIKFSTEYPNHLAIGFYSGELLIIDISSRCLNIIFKKSEQLLLETNSILELFWTVQIVKNFRLECLVTCSCSGRIARYLYSHGTFVETIILQLSQVQTCLVQDKKHTTSSIVKSNINCVTKFIGLNKNTYLVGTRDGMVYSCLYDNSMKYLTKTTAHYGNIRSLEKSPHDPDVYLTTGYDCLIKIWIGSILIEPVIILKPQKQIEKAIWSRTNSTVILSIIDNCIHIWDLSLYFKNALVSVHKLQQSSNKLCNIEFTLDGKHLCVSDISGTVIVYAWSDILPTGEFQEKKTLIYCIAASVYYTLNEENLIKKLCKKRPEFSSILLSLENDFYKRLSKIS